MIRNIVYSFFILSLISINTYAKMSACDLWQDLPNDKYLKVLKYQDSLFTKISNTRLFYKVSDQLLAKATDDSSRTKKDFLTKWAVYSQISTGKQSIIIKEWRKQFLMAVLLPSYLKLSQNQQKVLNEAFVNLHNFTFPQEIKDSYQNILNQAKTLSYNLIDSQNFPKKTAMILKGNIARIKLNWVNSIETSLIASNPMKYFDTDIEFNPKYNVITIGQKASQHFDGDTILSIMIQQMAQSFSPCRWSILYSNMKFPYEKVTKCLQGINSISAKTRDDSKIDQFLKEKKISKEQKITLLKYPSCNTPYYPTNGMQYDQTNTAFTDWFSAEAMSQFSKLSPNFREDLCSIKATTTLQSYPANFERLVRIYFANKKIRDLVNVKIDKNIVQCKL